MQSINRQELYRRLGLVVKGDKLPPDLLLTKENVTLPGRRMFGPGPEAKTIGYGPVGNDGLDISATVTVLPSERKGNCSRHRVLVRCPKCERLIPFGRFHQHYDTKTCKNNQ